MIYAQPGSSYTAVLEAGIGGLVGKLTVQLEKSDGTTAVPATKLGIVEVEPTVYAKADLVAPVTADTYILVWDNEGERAAEELIVTMDLPAPIVPAYDVSTDLGRVRLLISDVGGPDGKTFAFSDAEIDGFLGLGGNVKQAAAEALRTIAGNEAQVSKRIEYLELKTDGPAVAKELGDLADKLEAKAEQEAGAEEDIQIAEMAPQRLVPDEFRL
jgi:hypothetical protein